MIDDINRKDPYFIQRDEGDAPILDVEVLRLYKMRRLLSKAWMPMGISKEEAVDIFIWMIGDDADKIHLSQWPNRIRENTGVSFNEKTPLITIFQEVAKRWRKKRPMLIVTPR